jgi:excisionase family DNA binding protein
MARIDTENFLKTEEVEAYLHIDQRTIYRLVHAGKLPAVRVGRQWRFRREDIEAWLVESQAAASRTNTVPRILVVDDEPKVREMVAKTLATVAFEVDTAPDGPAALDLLRKSAYDLVITDLRMPGMDGLSLMRATRRLAPGIPFVVITAYSTEASAIEAINIGVSGYLTKPFRVQRIVAVTSRALGMPIRFVDRGVVIGDTEPDRPSRY